nr:lipase family protein [Nocardia panacis]
MKLRRAVTALAAAGLLTGSLAGAALAEPAGGAPGAVVGNTELPAELWLDGTGSARRLTYWTRTSLDEPALSTGAIFVPAGTPPPGGWPVLSWEHGTVGVADECAPSVAGRSDRDKNYLSTWLKQGYAVVATDYIGLGTPGVHTYLDGRAEAHAGIDMVRAARAVDPTLAAKWMAIGQSQGGGAAVFTAAMATRYAPELDYRGAVATGPASNVVEAASLIGPQTPPIPSSHLTAYAAYIMVGLKAARPAFDADAYLTPIGKEVVTAAEQMCLTAQAAEKFGSITVNQLFSQPLSSGPFAEYAHEVMDVPLTGYDRPLFLGQGTNDTDVFLPLTLKLIADLETHGVRPEVHIYPGLDHSATVAGSLPDSMPFVARAFS